MHTQYAIKVTINQPHELQGTLDAAVHQAIEQGLGNPGHGVLITRHDHQTFTIELSSEVPQGTIAEMDLRLSA